MLPEKLNVLIEENEPEDVSIQILKADFENGDLNIKIRVSHIDHVFEWKISAINYYTSRLSFNPANTIEILLDHPLLWFYLDIQSELYFNGICKNIDQLFVDLYQVHYRFFKGLMEFENTINCTSSFNNLITSKIGQLAKGPNLLMREYSIVLQKHGIDYSIIGERIPWKGEKEFGKPKVLFIDDSYIIAGDFIFSEDNIQAAGL